MSLFILEPLVSNFGIMEESDDIVRYTAMYEQLIKIFIILTYECLCAH